MKVYITRLITPERDVTFETFEPMSLEQAQALVGGYVELLETADGKQMLVDEDGRMKQLRPNVAASNRWLGGSNALFGNAVVFENYEWD
jgi:hypothetical protein